MAHLETYIDGAHRNSRSTLKQLPHYEELLGTVEAAFARGLDGLGSSAEGAVVFAAMSHAAFLAATSLATSGQLPPAYMVMRGCVEDAIYGYFLFHHPDLKKVWSARGEGPEAKKKIRDEFTIGRMKKFLTEKDVHLGEQFSLIYDATIDLGAHPNALAAFSHLVELEGGDFEWQYLNTSRVDQSLALRLTAMAGVFALNIFRTLFSEHFNTTGASELVVRAHDLLDRLPTPEQDAGI